jgi:uncharacterized protein (DUF2461 family)
MATPTAATPFTGFTPEAIQFLVDLAANNDRTWFQPRKADYERLMKPPRGPLRRPGRAIRGARNPPARRSVRSPFRIYRSVRFSKD